MSYIVEVTIQGCEPMYLGPLTAPLPATGAGAPGETVSQEELDSIGKARQYVMLKEQAHEFDTMKEATDAIGVHAGEGVTFAITSAW